MRVLSPSTEPPVRMLEGSTASTPTWCPSAVSRVPSASMNVDLPTPGTPEIPTRTARPVLDVEPGQQLARRLAVLRAWTTRPA